MIWLVYPNKDNGNSQIISWTKDGNSFVIFNIEAFVKILPKYFKTKNYSSFVRQLNLYNFHKIKNPEGNIEFGHEKFRRDDLESLQFIIRKVGQESDIEKHRNKVNKPLSFEYNRLLGIIRNLENSLKSENQKNEQRNKENKELLNQLESRKQTCAKKTRKLMFIVWMISDNLDADLILKIRDFFSKNEVAVEYELFDKFEEINIPMIIDENLLSSLDNSDFFIDQLLILVTNFHNSRHKNMNNQISITNILVNFEESKVNKVAHAGNHPQLVNTNSCAMSDLYNQENDYVNVLPSVCNFSVSSDKNEDAEFLFENTSLKSRMNSINTTFEFEYMDFEQHPDNLGGECHKPSFYKL